ncbi:hypothetical protein Z046_14995 [Pseudomonas aeruginosa VRFPA09]|nr:hypothetical protein Z046_14995 [Pseudomonas aeruginosa VRFPA09]
MLGSAFWLTLATLLGLCLGFAREWLLVASWGAGERSDAFLIALFLPEALRMSLAGGVLSAAACWRVTPTPPAILACHCAASCSAAR